MQVRIPAMYLKPSHPLPVNREAEVAFITISELCKDIIRFFNCNLHGFTLPASFAFYTRSSITAFSSFISMEERVIFVLLASEAFHKKDILEQKRVSASAHVHKKSTILLCLH